MSQQFELYYEKVIIPWENAVLKIFFFLKSLKLALCKTPKYHLIFWCGNFFETCSNNISKPRNYLKWCSVGILIVISDFPEKKGFDSENIHCFT